MRFARVLCLFSALAVASFQIKAQTFTVIHVHLPFNVIAGSQTLSPGDYIIRPVFSTSDVFAVYGDNGMKLETVLSAVPMEKAHPSDKTDLLVRSDGNEYVIDQMWIEGSDTGYQFVSPELVRSREQERQSPKP